MPTRETQPRVLAVRSFMVLKVDSIGFVVQMCYQCSDGKIIKRFIIKTFSVCNFVNTNGSSGVAGKGLVYTATGDCDGSRVSNLKVSVAD